VGVSRPVWGKMANGCTRYESRLHFDGADRRLCDRWQTIFISERLIARGTDPRVRPNPLYVSEGLDLVDECIRLNQTGEMMDAPGGIPAPIGSRWLAGSAVHDGYYHLFPPNSDWKDCVKSLGQGGVISARSHHPQSVVVAFGDGAVRPVANAVDQTIWRAWSTRAGGEVIAVE